MRIHLIAIGGSAMHNLALALHHKGYNVSGSDDEIYDPARSRLAKYGLLPDEIGWHPDRITADIDAIIVGMHARKNNPELIKAQELGITIQSYPEYVYEQSKNKKRLVVAGSHGKTTTTAMILHVLNYCNYDTDYLVGAQLAGFDTMVRLSDAPLIVIEGDEYLASPLKPFPKIHFYHPHIAIITGIAWDHINVFPTFENYVYQFAKFVTLIKDNGTLIYFDGDEHINGILDKVEYKLSLHPYNTPNFEVVNNRTFLNQKSDRTELNIFGEHNLQNMEAARLACNEVGINNAQFYEGIASFGGAAKRLQKLTESEDSVTFQDFAHAPSKVKATITAVKNQYKNRTLLACLELHTFSSLNKDFLGEYTNAMDDSDIAFVYFSEHTLKMKKLPSISKEEVKEAFGHPNMRVFTNSEELQKALLNEAKSDVNYLLMSSGNFGGIELKSFAKEIEANKEN